jgi:hypothetical protein
LKIWCESKINNKEVEENSSLGSAIKYMLKHWQGLTQFLRVAGAPIDNNFMENKLRLAVINRKNFLFYKTEIGALVGDIIMSIIQTCQESSVNF